MKKVYLFVFLLGFILSCGSGSSPPPSDNVSPYIRIQPPIVWVDNTPLIPERDLSFWKIYAMDLDNNTSAWFTEKNEVAQTAIVSNGVLVTEFNLNLLKPFLDNGTYMIGLKVQALDGQQSDFADNTVLWEKK